MLSLPRRDAGHVSPEQVTQVTLCCRRQIKNQEVTVGFQQGKEKCVFHVTFNTVLLQAKPNL